MRQFIISFLAILVWVGCATTSSNVDVNMLYDMGLEPNTGTVRVYPPTTDLGLNYDEIAELSIEVSRATTPAEATRVLQMKAAELGATGLLMNEPEKSIVFGDGVQRDLVYHSGTAIYEE